MRNFSILLLLSTLYADALHSPAPLSPPRRRSPPFFSAPESPESIASFPESKEILAFSLKSRESFASSLESRESFASSPEPLEESHFIVSLDHVVTNLAANRTGVKMSSSLGSDPRWAVDGDANTCVLTAVEKKSPYVVVDLGTEAYVDEITLLGHAPQRDAESEISVFLTSQRASAYSRNQSLLEAAANWQVGEVKVVGAHLTVHVHATGRYVRVQSPPSTQLALCELEVRGVRLNPRDKVYAKCLSGHDGQDICSSRGVCDSGRCRCGLFFNGLRCEVVSWPIYASSSLVLFAISGFVFIVFATPRRRRTIKGLFLTRNLFSGNSLENVTKKEDPEMSESLFSDSAKPQEERASPSATNPVLATNPAAPRVLHVLFSSPLVMTTTSRNNEIVPVAQLDVERECDLLRMSLSQAHATHRIDLLVNVATIDALQSILTLREASVLHLSSHCSESHIALEDATGAAHLISISALTGLLKACNTCETSSRLVVLNSCHSEGVARAFLAVGFPHVVALRLSCRVKDTTSAIFTRSFYLALSSYRSVGEAFQIAREAVSLAPGSTSEELSFVLLPEGGDHNEIVWPMTPGALRHSDVIVKPMFPPAFRLPPPCEEFMGRAVELWNVSRMLTVQRYRFVNVFGRVGTGKSALAIHVSHFFRVRNVFPDGIYFVHVPDILQSEDDATCVKIGEFLVSCIARSGGSTVKKTNSGLKTKDVGFQRFAIERPHSLVVLDGAPSSLLYSHLFIECASSMLRLSPKLQILSTCANRFDATAFRVGNVGCGSLSEDESARLLVRLVQPKLVLPAFFAQERGQATPDDELEETVHYISKSRSLMELGGHVTSIRRLASKLNSHAGNNDELDVGALSQPNSWW